MLGLFSGDHVLWTGDSHYKEQCFESCHMVQTSGIANGLCSIFLPDKPAWARRRISNRPTKLSLSLWVAVSIKFWLARPSLRYKGSLRTLCFGFR